MHTYHLLTQACEHAHLVRLGHITHDHEVHELGKGSHVDASSLAA